ncbi:MAG TPA: SusE domain-containing protein [Puia sp.]|jgi:hypothetical protein
MKKIFLLMMAVTFLIASCKKDEARAVLHAPASPKGFASSSSQIVLSSTNDSAVVTKFSWQAADYGFPASVTYTLIFDSPSDTSGANGWANAIKMTIASDSLNKSWLGADFNHLLNQLGLEPGVASPLVVRLKVDVNQSTGAASAVPSIFSDLPLTVTPYHVVLIYPKLYLAGDFLTPNWTQKDQPGWILASVKSDENYDGYVSFPNANNNFKLCSQLDWNGTNYGWGTSGTTMSTAGNAGNLWFGGPGYCRVKANVKDLTISYDPMQFRIAGDFNGWDLSATPMTFDAGANVWTAAGVSMKAGDTFKFEGNGSWTAEIGWDSKGNLVAGGGNIVAAKTGTFTVTLDLSQAAGNLTFSAK